MSASDDFVDRLLGIDQPNKAQKRKFREKQKLKEKKELANKEIIP